MAKCQGEEKMRTAEEIERLCYCIRAQVDKLWIAVGSRSTLELMHAVKLRSIEKTLLWVQGAENGLLEDCGMQRKT